jgi:hypothetical protein
VDDLAAGGSAGDQRLTTRPPVSRRGKHPRATCRQVAANPRISQEPIVPRISIQQFRAALASRSEQGAAVRAYRALTRRPEVAAGTLLAGWREWPEAAAPLRSA